jgi:hypothetical protein
MWEILRCSGGSGRTIDTDRAAGDIDQSALGLDKEMVVVGDVGIEICALPANRDLAQQARVLELMQVLYTVASDTRSPAFTASSCRISAVTWRSPLPNSSAASATRCRVGRNPARRNSLETSTPIIIAAMLSGKSIDFGAQHVAGPAPF